jgi:hypothetical protein
MTLRRMLERASAARESFEDHLDRLNAVRPDTALDRGAVSADDIFSTVVSADLSRALADIAALNAPPACTIVDGGILTSETSEGRQKRESSP